VTICAIDEHVLETAVRGWPGLQGLMIQLHENSGLTVWGVFGAVARGFRMREGNGHTSLRVNIVKEGSHAEVDELLCG